MSTNDGTVRPDPTDAASMKLKLSQAAAKLQIDDKSGTVMAAHYALADANTTADRQFCLSVESNALVSHDNDDGIINQLVNFKVLQSYVRTDGFVPSESEMLAFSSGLQQAVAAATVYANDALLYARYVHIACKDLAKVVDDDMPFEASKPEMAASCLLVLCGFGDASAHERAKPIMSLSEECDELKRIVERLEDIIDSLLVCGADASRVVKKTDEVREVRDSLRALATAKFDVWKVALRAAYTMDPSKTFVEKGIAYAEKMGREDGWFGSQ